jgi:AcrR family transcriptional regulator
MRSNVDAADKAVNDNNAGSVYTNRYAALVTATRPYHHGNLREALLREGERALESGGAQRLSLRELAREVGVSHAAPRRHFADRQALLDALAQSGFERLGTRMATAIADAGPGADERFAGLARTYVRFATEHPALTELMFAVKHQPDATTELRAAAEQAFTAPMALVTDGQAAGEIVPGDPERVAMVAWAAVSGLAAMANNGLLGDTPLDELIDEAAQRLVLGLRPR